jgi:hypothetical protein
MTRERVDRSLAFVVGTEHYRSLGFARDDKKRRVVVKERAVAKGQGGCQLSKDAVTAKRDLGCQSAKSKKSQALGMLPWVSSGWTEVALAALAVVTPWPR